LWARTLAAVRALFDWYVGWAKVDGLKFKDKFGFALVKDPKVLYFFLEPPVVELPTPRLNVFLLPLALALPIRFTLYWSEATAACPFEE
jgi:hypothetical protein